MDGPDIAGHGPALRPDVPVEVQRAAAVAAARRRRRLGLVAAGLAAVVVAGVLAGRGEPDPPVPAPAPAAVAAPAQVIDVAAGVDRAYALLGGCAGPEQARQCAYRLMAQTRGGPWAPLAVPLPPARAGTGFAARLVLSGEDTVAVLDDADATAYVSVGGGPFAVRPVRDGPPLAAAMPTGQAPELVDDAVTALDPVTGQRRPLAAQPELGAPPSDVVRGPLDDLWAVAGSAERVVVGHSGDGGRSWRASAVPGLGSGYALLRLVPGRDGGVYLLGSRRGAFGAPVELDELWWQPGGGAWRRIGTGPRPPSFVSVGPGRSGLLLTDGTGRLWRLSADGRFAALPEPVVDGRPVRVAQLFFGPAGRTLGLPAGRTGDALLLASADDGDSWLPTLTPG